MTPASADLTRRQFLAAGAVVVSFSLAPSRGLAAKGPSFGDLAKAPMLDSWIGINADGAVTVFTGKAELGQGIKTALVQIAAEQLAVPLDHITLVTAATGRTPDEGYTAGSRSMEASGTAILHAASQVRHVLMRWAAARLKTDIGRLSVEDGIVKGPNGASIGYGQLVKGRSLHIRATTQSDLVPPSAYKVMGKSVPRIDIPAKLTGGASFVQDLRLEGMLHARVVRPPNYGASLTHVDTAAVEKLPGVTKIVRDGSFLAVVAEGEYQAIAAMRALQKAAQWNVSEILPDQDETFARLVKATSKDTVLVHKGHMPNDGSVIEAVYHRPYTMHGAIGPSCAVALFAKGHLTVWTHSQGVYPLRATIAKMLSLPVENVDCIHLEGAGCYGHNGADDAGADAALIAHAMPGRPIRVQWMREDEHGWEPYGSAMVTHARGTVGSDGRIAGWAYDVWSMPHATRPGGNPDNLMPAWYISDKFGPPVAFEIGQPSGGGDRNAVPLYGLENSDIVKHFIPEMPLRVSALRSLGGYMNVLSIESFMDELALAAKADPVAFRLRHLDDSRARDVVQLAAKSFGWHGWTRQAGRGRGFAFVRYEATAAYCALALEVEVVPETGHVRVVRAVAAVDSGNAVNPDGIRNQIEGGIIQATSWTLYEQVDFSRRDITSRDWSSYPILRFDAVPDSVDVHVINRPDQPFLGTGEASQGVTGAAIANAIADATGIRLRDLPFTAAKVRKALL